MKSVARHLAPLNLATLVLAVASFGCALTMPLPPELKNAPTIATTGRSRMVIMGKVKPISFKPYVLKDLETGSGSHAISAGAVAFGSAIGFEWRRVEGGLSFRLEKESTEPTTLSIVSCVWGLATTSGGFSRGAYGTEFRMPSGSSLVCELTQSPGAEPWRLLLWTGAPSNPIVPEFPSGGVLQQRDVRYAAESTNVVEPMGIHAQFMTGTLFLREGQAVAAVDRNVPGRVLAQPSLSPEEQSLFVAVGAAIFVYDTQTWSLTH